jgi:hypothetical protein
MLYLHAFRRCLINLECSDLTLASHCLCNSSHCLCDQHMVFGALGILKHLHCGEWSVTRFNSLQDFTHGWISSAWNRVQQMEGCSNSWHRVGPLCSCITFLVPGWKPKETIESGLSVCAFVRACVTVYLRNRSRFFPKLGTKLGVKNVRNIARQLFLYFSPFSRKALIYANLCHFRPFLAIFGT